MELTKQEQTDFDNATECHICHKELKILKNGKMDKVRDHDHMKPPGRNYRGAAHNACNLRMSLDSNFGVRIPVFFHNLKGYDNHFIVNALVGMKEEIDIIPFTSENYLSTTWKNVCSFRDSNAFLLSSLDKLVDTLKKDKHKFPITHQELRRQKVPEDAIKLLIGKGAFPYLWHDHPDKMSCTTFPAWSVWKAEKRKHAEYKRGKAVWKAANCKTWQDYHDLYLTTDVLLLADVFEVFRNNTMKHFQLDPSWYLTTPSLAWDAVLLHCRDTDQPIIENFKEGQEDMLLFTEMMKRGGLCVLNRKHAKANHPGIKGYDPSKPHEWILHIDANNLYAVALTSSLPYGGYKWGDAGWFQKHLHDEFMKIDADAPEGHFLMVDAHFPKDSHHALADLPPMVEPREVSEYELSAVQKGQMGNRSTKGLKLIADLNPKTKYVIHYRNLQYMLKLGLVVTKVHKVLTFKQAKFFKSFVDRVTQLRLQAKSKGEKDLFKLINNSIAGKCIENMRKRVDFKIVETPEQLWRARRFQSVKEVEVDFDGDCVGLMLNKRRIKMDKPIAIGVSVYELSKLHMMHLHHDVFVPHFGRENIELMYMDTDSFFYRIRCTDLRKDLLRLRSHMDFSNIHQDTFFGALYDETNAFKLGKMKDETEGVPIGEFIGLAPKMYAYEKEYALPDTPEKPAEKSDRLAIETLIRKYFEGEEEETQATALKTAAALKSAVVKKCKGTQHAVMENDVRMEHYRNTLMCGEFGRSYTTQELGADPTYIRSKNHQLYTVTQHRKVLGPVDGKRFWVNNIESLPYGHYAITESAPELHNQQCP